MTFRCQRKSNSIDMHDLQMKENMTSKHVSIHHRICGAQKHLRQGTGNVINLCRNQGKLFE